MGMMGEIAVEGTVRAMCQWLESKINDKDTDTEERAAFKEAGLHALTLFDYSWPAWADDYKKLFES